MTGMRRRISATINFPESGPTSASAGIKKNNLEGKEARANAPRQCPGAFARASFPSRLFFLMPALAEVGPDSGKFMAALMRRRVPVILPIVALTTLVSGDHAASFTTRGYSFLTG